MVNSECKLLDTLFSPHRENMYEGMSVGQGALRKAPHAPSVSSCFAGPCEEVSMLILGVYDVVNYLDLLFQKYGMLCTF